MRGPSHAIANLWRRYSRDPARLVPDAILLPQMLYWTARLRRSKRKLTLAELVHAAARPVSATPDPRSWPHILRLARWSSELLGGSRDGCVERALVAYRFLRGAGARPVVVAGVRTQASAWEGHAWIEMDGRPPPEMAADAEGFEAMMRLGAEP